MAEHVIMDIERPLTGRRRGAFVPRAGMIYGYARESAASERLEAQTDLLTQAGCSQVFQEKHWRGRQELARLTNIAKAGDTVIVTSLDRAASTIRELSHLVRSLAASNAVLRSLTDPWADAGTGIGQNLPALLERLAAFERVGFRDRMNTSRQQARLAGVKMGPRPKLSEADKAQIRSLWVNGDGTWTMSRLADRFNVSVPTISRIVSALNHIDPQRHT